MIPPRIRMGRTAMTLFVVLATAVAACGGNDDDTGLFQAAGGAGNGAGGTLQLGKGGAGNDTAAGGAEAGGSSSKGGSGGKGGGATKGGAGGDEPSGGTGGAGGEGDAGAAGSDDPGGAGGAAAGKGGAAGKSGAGGKAGTSGKGGAAGKSGSAGTGGSAGGGTAGSGGSDPYATSIVPKTCSETHGFAGCCGPDGKTIYYFSGGKVASESCKTAGESCSWDAANKYYGCDVAVGADPAGKYPLVCGGPPVEGACSDGSGGAGSGGGAGAGGANGDGIPETCSEAHGTIGCCVGDTLYTGTLLTATPQSCAASNQKCGWNSSTSQYACGSGSGSDPSGTYSRACFGPFTGGQCLN